MFSKWPYSCHQPITATLFAHPIDKMKWNTKPYQDDEKFKDSPVLNSFHFFRLPWIKIFDQFCGILFFEYSVWEHTIWNIRIKFDEEMAIMKLIREIMTMNIYSTVFVWLGWWQQQMNEKWYKMSYSLQVFSPIYLVNLVNLVDV